MSIDERNFSPISSMAGITDDNILCCAHRSRSEYSHLAGDRTPTATLLTLHCTVSILLLLIHGVAVNSLSLV